MVYKYRGGSRAARMRRFRVHIHRIAYSIHGIRFSVNKNDSVRLRERLPHPRPVQSETIAQCVQATSYPNLRLGVVSTNARHDFAALRVCVDVHARKDSRSTHVHMISIHVPVKFGPPDIDNNCWIIGFRRTAYQGASLKPRKRLKNLAVRRFTKRLRRSELQPFQWDKSFFRISPPQCFHWDRKDDV
jgi:hypothetical protein